MFPSRRCAGAELQLDTGVGVVQVRQRVMHVSKNNAMLCLPCWPIQQWEVALTYRVLLLWCEKPPTLLKMLYRSAEVVIVRVYSVASTCCYYLHDVSLLCCQNLRSEGFNRSGNHSFGTCYIHYALCRAVLHLTIPSCAFCQQVLYRRVFLVVVVVKSNPSAVCFSILC